MGGVTAAARLFQRRSCPDTSKPETVTVSALRPRDPKLCHPRGPSCRAGGQVPRLPVPLVPYQRPAGVTRNPCFVQIHSAAKSEKLANRCPLCHENFSPGEEVRGGAQRPGCNPVAGLTGARASPLWLREDRWPGQMSAWAPSRPQPVQEAGTGTSRWRGCLRDWPLPWAPPGPSLLCRSSASWPPSSAWRVCGCPTRSRA